MPLRSNSPLFVGACLQAIATGQSLLATCQTDRSGGRIGVGAGRQDSMKESGCRNVGTGEGKSWSGRGVNLGARSCFTRLQVMHETRPDPIIFPLIAMHYGS